MPVLLLIPLVIAFFAVCVLVNSTDEIVQVAAACTTLICLFFSFVFAPLLLKVLIVLVPTLRQKFLMRRIDASQR